jgi:NAD(P)-dependent dehydrogenase (short-subunit alcohol dehydrogenase family)
VTFALDDKVALVTGAAQGIGRAIALGLAGAGATVFCGDVKETDPTVRAIADAGGRGQGLALDIAREEDVNRAMTLLDASGGIDLLVNNAGIFPRSLVLDLEPAEWDRVMGVNLRGTFLCSRAAAGRMRARGRGGRIVNLTSGAAFVPTAQSAAYAASKAGIVALTRVLALELAADRITVNAVAPGLTDTAQPRAFYSDDDLTAFAGRIPAGRLGEPEDIVPAVLLLCSDEAAYITGQTLHVNGGLYMP